MLTALLFACGTPLTPDEVRLVPKSMQAVSSGSLQGVAGAAITTPPQVLVLAQDNGPLSNVAVTFSVSDTTSGVVPAGDARTGENGVATVSSWVMPHKMGSATLRATVPANSTIPAVTFVVTVEAGPPAAVAVADNSDNQSASAGTDVAIPPAVKVRDQFGNPVRQASVTFAVTSGGGSIQPADGAVTTDSAGKARLTSWTLGPSGGTNTLSATVTGTGVNGSPVTFTATGRVPNSLSASNQPWSGTRQGQPNLGEPRVQVLDQFGTAMEGVQVVWSSPDGNSTVNGTITATTDSSGETAFGIAEGDSWIATGVTGSTMTLTASVPNTSLTTSFTSTVVGVVATMERAAGDAQTDTVARQLPFDLMLRLRDAGGNVVPGDTITWTVGSSGGGITVPGDSVAVTPATTVTDSNGVILVRWTLGTHAAANSDSVTASDAPSGVSTIYTATATNDVPSALTKVTGDGQTASAGSVLPTDPEIMAVDAYGNAVFAETVDFVAGQGGSASLSSQVTDGAGVASVSWTLGPAAGAQTLDVSVDRYPNVTAQFTATAISSGSWSAVASLPANRSAMTAAAVGGKIYVAGGGNGYPNFYADALVYDPGSNAWSPIATSGVARTWSAENSALVDSVLYTMAGNPAGFCTTESEAYNIATDSWSVITAAPRERCHAASVGYNHQVWVLGGWDTGSTTRYTEMDVYDPGSNSWSTPASMPSWRGAFAAAVYNDKLYVFGGGVAPSGNCTNDVAVYDFIANSWTTLAPMSSNRCGAAAVVANGRIYVLGGYDDGSNTWSSTVESYDPGTDTWRSEPSLTSPRAYLATAYVNGLLYAIGGENNGTVLTTVEVMAVP